MWTRLYFSAILTDWVPFPEPGGPNKIKLNIFEFLKG
jgi:hypothetical protein